jgi:GT2 family glycosyltransferase
MTDVTISVVAHKQLDDLQKLMPSLLEAAGKVSSEVLVVDNRSNDGTADYLADLGGRISALHNPRRAGYGENHNLNLRRASGRYFVIMNADMIVGADVFLRLYEFMEQNPSIGMVAPKMLNPDGTLQPFNRRLPTLTDLFLRRFAPRWMQRRFRLRLEAYEMLDVGYERICDVPFLSGAFLFCRTEVLRAIGGFDERYFLYFEDVDLCRRVARTHWTVFFPGAMVTHVWKRAAHKDWRFTWYFMQSMAKYFLRWGIRLS